MQKIRYLLSNINLANILLAGGLIAVAYFTFFAASSVRVKYKRPVVKKAAVDKKPAEVKKVAQDEKNPSPADYMVVAEQNLFNPGRKIPEQKDQKQAAPLPKPDFVLDGTLMTNGMKIAFMEDKKAPVNTPGRPNRQTALRMGDSLSGFTLTEIDVDKVVMQRGEEKVVVALDSAEKDKTRHHSETAAAAPGSAPGPARPIPPGAVRQKAAGPTPTPAARQAARNKFFKMFKSMRR